MVVDSGRYLLVVDSGRYLLVGDSGRYLLVVDSGRYLLVVDRSRYLLVVDRSRYLLVVDSSRYYAEESGGIIIIGDTLIFIFGMYKKTNYLRHDYGHKSFGGCDGADRLADSTPTPNS